MLLHVQSTLLIWLYGFMGLGAKNEMVGVDTPYAVITNKAPAMLTNMQYFHFCEKIRHS